MIWFSHMRRMLGALVILTTFAGVAPACAQQAQPTLPAQPAPDTVRKGTTPRSAFVRSLLVPGWGQFSVGAEKRAITFLTLQSASWFMLIKTLNKLSDAHTMEDERIALVSDSLHALMDRDTMEQRILSVDSAFRNRIDAADTVVAIRGLIASREEQRQDWIAYTAFLTLAGALDAFIAAHLADFPAAISTGTRPDGAYQLKLTVPLSRRRP